MPPQSVVANVPKMHFLFSLKSSSFPRESIKNVVSARKSRQQTGLKAIWRYICCRVTLVSKFRVSGFLECYSHGQVRVTLMSKAQKALYNRHFRGPKRCNFLLQVSNCRPILHLNIFKQVFFCNLFPPSDFETWKMEHFLVWKGQNFNSPKHFSNWGFRASVCLGLKPSNYRWRDRKFLLQRVCRYDEQFLG